MATAITYPHIVKEDGAAARLEGHPRTRVAMIVMDYLARGLSVVALVAAGMFAAWYVREVEATIRDNDPQGRPIIDGVIYDLGTNQVINGLVYRQPFPSNIIPKVRMDPVSLAMLIQQFTLPGMTRSAVKPL